MLPVAAFTFADALITVIEIALFVAWICLLVYVYADIFRSHDLSGGVKALWVVGIFIFPLLGTLLYLIVRGGQMHERSVLAHQAMQRGASFGGASTDELERLSALHDRGKLSDEEFRDAKDRLLRSGV